MESDGSWFGRSALGVLLGVFGWYLWPYGQASGGELAAVGSTVFWLLSVKNLYAGLRTWDIHTVLDRARTVGVDESHEHGRARWATRRDLEDAGMTKSGGLFLGTLDGKRELFHNGEGSMLAIAGPGQGKSTCLAMQHLLRCKDSTVVMDTKLELWATCGRALEKKGFRVWVINPWAENFTAQFGGAIEATDDGFDPCAFLDPASPNVIDDCALLASLLLPASSDQKESEDFWRDFSQQILVGFLLLALENDGRVTLPGLRRALMAPAAKLEASIEAMEQSTAFSGVLAEYGARMAGPYVNSPKEWSGGLSGAMKALRVFDAHGPLGQHLSGGQVDFRTLKDRPTVCFIAVPSDKVATHSDWVAMVVTLAMEMVARDRRFRRVTFLLDEFQNLPRLDPVLKGIALYRGAGIQFVLLVQFISALKRLYGESFREFLGCEVVTAFGATSDVETLRFLSELAGQESFRDQSFSTQPEQVGEETLGMSMGLRDQGRPLIRLEEVRLLQEGKQLIFAKNLPPILADKQSYLDVPRLRRMADPNPYYREKKKHA